MNIYIVLLTVIDKIKTALNVNGLNSPAWKETRLLSHNTQSGYKTKVYNIIIELTDEIF